jgi:hypothetical protein
MEQNVALRNHKQFSGSPRRALQPEKQNAGNSRQGSVTEREAPIKVPVFSKVAENAPIETRSLSPRKPFSLEEPGIA